ncbi:MULTISPECIES: hypothetical protein [Candidatus Cardinium]|uniref:hypothetical protein n=1 Tax=Candidatus Cardinium TaxID=273135 RepID=UPI001FAA6644|nr:MULTISPECIES: hypothetical protein [Cardinium]
MLSKIYTKVMLTMALTSIPCYASESKVSARQNSHNHDNHGYVDCHSWAAYLHHHPGYKPYHPVTNIKKHGCNWGTWVTFPQKIEAIQARVGHIGTPLELCRSKDFLVIYKHPRYYEEAFFNYIVDKRYTLEQKKIAAYAMSKHSYTYWERFCQLYKKKEIELPLLELMLAIHITNSFNDCHFKIIPTKKIKRVAPALERIQNNIPKDSSLHNHLKSILVDNQLPKLWDKYRIDYSGDISRFYYTDYYTENFLFYDILTDAVKEADYVINGEPGSSPFHLDRYPYFLMVMEHPETYYPAHCELGPRNQREQDKSKKYTDGIDVLRYKGYTDEEKSMAIFGMSQLGVTDSRESSGYYAFMIDHAIEWYKLGNLSVHHLLELFICNFPTFYKYPFFILDYKEEAIQKALNKFIAEPTIPEGIKEVARKVKNGTLATKEEMDYMQGYRTFRKTHFTLYETIVPRG